MEDTLFQTMVRTIVETDFDHAVKRYKTNQSADNWVHLRNTMAALQFIGQDHGKRWVENNVRDTGIGKISYEIGQQAIQQIRSAGAEL